MLEWLNHLQHLRDRFYIISQVLCLAWYNTTLKCSNLVISEFVDDFFLIYCTHEVGVFLKIVTFKSKLHFLHLVLKVLYTYMTESYKY